MVELMVIFIIITYADETAYVVPPDFLQLAGFNFGTRVLKIHTVSW